MAIAYWRTAYPHGATHNGHVQQLFSDFLVQRRPVVLDLWIPSALFNGLKHVDTRECESLQGWASDTVVICILSHDLFGTAWISGDPAIA